MLYEVITQREIVVEARSRAGPGLVRESGEVGVGEMGMSVEGNGQDVGSLVEDLLGAVPVSYNFV